MGKPGALPFHLSQEMNIMAKTGAEIASGAILVLAILGLIAMARNGGKRG